MRTIATFLAIFLISLLLPSVTHAKRLLPRAVPAKSGGGTAVVSTSRGVGAKVRFRGDKLAIIVDFSSLSIASSVSYNLSYATRGTSQGAGGNISPSEDSTSRELIFGTCSHGVCRYDSGITNAKFVVTTVLKNGRKVVKPFKLKV